VVNIFDRGAAPPAGGAIVSAEVENTIFEDSGITSHIWPVCDDHHKEFFKEADRLSGAPVASIEGEYGGGGTTSELSGRMPDLNLLKNPQIGWKMMEWRNHAIAKETDEEKTCPPDDHKGGEDDSVAEMNEECCSELTWPSKIIDAPETDHVICKMNLSVPCFEGEEDIQDETLDSLVAQGSPALIEPRSPKFLIRPILH